MDKHSDSHRFPLLTARVDGRIIVPARASPCRIIVLYGLEATGKSAITRAVLEKLSLPASGDEDTADLGEDLRFAIVKSLECISGRHLLEQTIGAVARTLEWTGTIPRCEDIAQLAVELHTLVEVWSRPSRRFVLVFDGIDHQREAPPTLLPALARMGEIIPHLATIFITTSPGPNFLHLSGVPFIHFQSYTKDDLLQIISLHRPEPPLPAGIKATKEVWSMFCSTVWDSLCKHSGRDVVSFSSVCFRLWPAFIRPIMDGIIPSSNLSGILVANRSMFQNDKHLVPQLVADSSIMAQRCNAREATKQDLGAQLPYFSRILLVAAYLASYNPPRTDHLLFMKEATMKRRKKGGGTAKTRPGTAKSRKISRNLLGPQAFPLERMLAIFHAIRADADGNQRVKPGAKTVTGSADIQTAIATLTSLRFLIKMGNANVGNTLEGGSKWKIAVGWEVVRGVSRSMGIEAEDYVAERM